MSKEAYINSGAATFQQDAIEASGDQLVLVDFWAAWCGPCQSLAPVLEKLAAEYQGSMKLVKVDTDREQALSMQFGIRSLPTVLFFKEGRKGGGPVHGCAAGIRHSGKDRSVCVQSL